MKRKIIVSAIGLFVLLTCIIYANAIKNTGIKENNAAVDVAEKREKIKKHLTDESFIELMEKQGCYIDEINISMKKLLNISAMYDLSDKEIKGLYNLVKKGNNLNKLLDIYVFTLDTEYPKDINYIKKIYDESKKTVTTSKYWIEEAYNRLENNKHGILGEKEINEYISKGISIEEIHYANIASRKGNNKVSDIIDKKINGEEWNTIISDVYEDKKIKKVKASSLSEIMESIYYSEITGESVETVKENNQFSKQAENKINSKMQIYNHLSKDFEIMNSDNEKIIEFAKEKLPDTPENIIKKYVKKGYLIKELEENNNKAKIVNMSLEDYME